MIDVRTGDLFESGAQTLVNTVNCVGVMGKGIARAFRERFPEMFDDYKQRCVRKKVHLGEPYLFKPLVPPWILNFPTKDHWRSVSRLDDIIAGLRYLEAHYQPWGITSIAVPPLGCGYGQLEWRVVGPTLYRYLARLDIPVALYAPHGTPEAELERRFLAEEPAAATTTNSVTDNTASRVPAAWVALAAIIGKLEQEPHHWPVGRTTFQKLAYFATAEGLPTGLRYARGSYGPFSEGVKPMLARLMNNGLLVERQLGRMLAVQTGPTFRDAVRRFRPDIEAWAPALRRVTDLFLRMRTQDAEVAATVVYAARELNARSQQPVAESQVLDEVRTWKQRRRPAIADEDFAEAIRNLNMLGWVELRPSSDLPLTGDAY